MSTQFVVNGTIPLFNPFLGVGKPGHAASQRYPGSRFFPRGFTNPFSAASILEEFAETSFPFEGRTMIFGLSSFPVAFRQTHVMVNCSICWYVNLTKFIVRWPRSFLLRTPVWWSKPHVHSVSAMWLNVPSQRHGETTDEQQQRGLAQSRVSSPQCGKIRA